MKSQPQDPRFKNRTWGTLRVGSDCEREKLTYPGHPARMKFKLSTAQAAIQTRLMDTRHTPDPLEQQAITDALNSLSALKRNAA